MLALGSLALPLFFTTGNILIGIGAVVFIVIGVFSRKPESYDSYRNRYEQRYGIDENSEEESE